MDTLIEIMKLALSAALTFGFAVWMLNIQKRKNYEQDQEEIKKMEAERKKIEAEVWQMVNDELREQIESYKGERALLIQKYSDLEKLFNTEREAWNKEKAFLEATINNLKDQISNMQKQLNSVKKTVKATTDQLKKGDTGPLPTTPR